MKPTWYSIFRDTGAIFFMIPFFCVAPNTRIGSLPGLVKAHDQGATGEDTAAVMTADCRGDVSPWYQRDTS